MEWRVKTVVTVGLLAGSLLLMAACSGTSGDEDSGADASTSTNPGDATDDTSGSSSSGGSSPDDPDAGEADPAGPSDDPGSGDTIETWVGVDLPVAITNLAAGAGRVAYETEVDGGTTAMVVVDASTGEETRFDVATGERLDRASFSDSRLVASTSDGFELRPTSTGIAFTGLSAYGDHGFEDLWSISAQQLQASAGQQVSVNGGWASSFDESSNLMAQWIGIPWPEEVEAGDDRPFAERPYGAAFGLDIESGGIRWSVSDVGICNSLGRIGFMALCRRSATFGDFEDVDYQTDLVEVIEIATGDVVWSYSFDEQVPLWDVDVTVVDGSFAVDVYGERIALEPFAALQADADLDDESDVFTCQVVATEFLELEGLRPERIHMEFVVPAREAPCLGDGTVITPEDALTRFGELPSGFAVDAGNGWSVWVDEDGRPNGISVPESSS